MPHTKITPRERAVQFFYRNAGTSYNPATETRYQGKRRGARRLARAESYAASMGWGFEWDYDPDGCIGCDCGHPDCACSTGAPHEVMCCLMRSEDGTVLASLGSIREPSVEYRRVVAAELALETMPD